MTNEAVTDVIEQYDSKHGRTSAADEARLVNLSEGSNKPSPEKVSFRVTASK